MRIMENLTRKKKTRGRHRVSAQRLIRQVYEAIESTDDVESVCHKLEQCRIVHSVQCRIVFCTVLTVQNSALLLLLFCFTVSSTEGLTATCINLVILAFWFFHLKLVYNGRSRIFERGFWSVIYSSST